MPLLGYMPVTLENLLVSLMDSNGLRSWQIFSEKDSSVTMKIRFNAVNMVAAKADIQAQASNVGYKRKSSYHTKRDQDRQLQHRMQTRSRGTVNDNYEAELPRTGNISPEKVMEIPMPDPVTPADYNPPSPVNGFGLSVDSHALANDPTNSRSIHSSPLNDELTGAMAVLTNECHG